MVRFKNRYAVVEFVWSAGAAPADLTNYSVFKWVRDAVKRNFGEFGLGVAMSSLQGRTAATTLLGCSLVPRS
jgi:hypothetical protein